MPYSVIIFTWCVLIGGTIQQAECYRVESPTAKVVDLGSNRITIKIDLTRCRVPHLKSKFKSSSNQPQINLKSSTLNNPICFDTNCCTHILLLSSAIRLMKRFIISKSSRNEIGNIEFSRSSEATK